MYEAAPGSTWLLTIDHDYDPETETTMMVHQSLHSTEKLATLSLFDKLHQITGATPAQILVVSESQREDGARFADVIADEGEGAVDADAERRQRFHAAISYSIQPFIIDEDRK